MSSGRVIDLQGPMGNAFALMGYADDFLRQMMSGDYENLVRIFEENFGDYVELVNKPGEEFDG